MSGVLLNSVPPCQMTSVQRGPSRRYGNFASDSKFYDGHCEENMVTLGSDQVCDWEAEVQIFVSYSGNSFLYPVFLDPYRGFALPYMGGGGVLINDGKFFLELLSTLYAVIK